MKNRGIIVFIIFILAIAAASALFWRHKIGQKTQAGPVASSTPLFDQSLSDGTIGFSYPSGEFGLAVNQTQVPVRSYIPPCDENFNYCLYYIGDKYKGTNFESAGVRIQKRADFAIESACLNTPPSGFGENTLPDSAKSDSAYSSSVFSSVGDAAAGHYAVGSLYRLFVKSNASCYEFETRIGQTQFLNYPPGSIKEFTESDMQDLNSKLMQIVEQVYIPPGKNNLFKL